MADPPRKPATLDLPVSGSNWIVRQTPQGTSAVPPDIAKSLRAEQWKTEGGPAGYSGKSMNQMNWNRDEPWSREYLQNREPTDADPELLAAFREMLLRRGL